MWGPYEPGWDFFRHQIDYIARNNYVLQLGVAKRDLAFWQKLTVYPGHVTARTYEPTDLEEAGEYSYLEHDGYCNKKLTLEKVTLMNT